MPVTRPAWFFFLMTGVLISSCSKKDPPPAASAGRLIFRMEHLVGGQALQEDTLIYHNTAGNLYMVTGLKYFLSDITLYRQGSVAKVISDWQDIFYIDENIPATKTLRFFDPLPPAAYDSVSFVFGITAEKNISNMFVNPPEVHMAWPQVLGGGYHYLMLDGKWIDTTGVAQPFNFHLGIGQLYHGTGYNTDSIYAFVHNWFRVSLPGSAVTIDAGDTTTMTVRMNIESWFDTPDVFDFNHWGGAIMQNQAAMQKVRDNGQDVFTASGGRREPAH